MEHKKKVFKRLRVGIKAGRHANNAGRSDLFKARNKRQAKVFHDCSALNVLPGSGLRLADQKGFLDEFKSWEGPDLESGREFRKHIN